MHINAGVSSFFMVLADTHTHTTHTHTLYVFKLGWRSSERGCPLHGKDMSKSRGRKRERKKLCRLIFTHTHTCTLQHTHSNQRSLTSAVPSLCLMEPQVNWFQPDLGDGEQTQVVHTNSNAHTHTHTPTGNTNTTQPCVRLLSVTSSGLTGEQTSASRGGALYSYSPAAMCASLLRSALTQAQHPVPVIAIRFGEQFNQ